MQFLFSPDTDKEFEGTMTSDDGREFLMSVEFGTNPGGTDEFAIKDTSGRYMPIPADLEHIDSLIDILGTIRDYVCAQENAIEMRRLAKGNHKIGVVTHV